MKNDIKQRLPTLVLKLRECADSFKKLSDTEAITQQETGVKEQLNRIRRQFLGYVRIVVKYLSRLACSQGKVTSQRSFRSLQKKRLKSHVLVLSIQ